MNKLGSKIRENIKNSKETSWSIIITFSLLYSAYVSFMNLVVIKYDIFEPISTVTYGLVNRTLTANLISIVLFVFVLMIKFGGVDLNSIGIKKNRIVSALVVTIIIWICIQAMNVIIALIISGSPTVHSSWQEHGVTRVLGSFIGQVFGNCLFEEIAFRGFLLVQICKKLRGKRGALLTAIALSQLIFALIHIPNRILAGMSLGQMLPSLIMVFILGLLFSAVYLATDNLFLAIGVHALWNTPLLIFQGYASHSVVLIFMLVLPVIWHRTFGRKNYSISSSS
jgi:uncharacterized protein